MLFFLLFSGEVYIVRGASSLFKLLQKPSDLSLRCGEKNADVIETFLSKVNKGTGGRRKCRRRKGLL